MAGQRAKLALGAAALVTLDADQAGDLRRHRRLGLLAGSLNRYFEGSNRRVTFVRNVCSSAVTFTKRLICAVNSRDTSPSCAWTRLRVSRAWAGEDAS